MKSVQPVWDRFRRPRCGLREGSVVFANFGQLVGPDVWQLGLGDE